MTPARLLLCLFASASLAGPALAQEAAPSAPIADTAFTPPTPATTQVSKEEPLPPNAPKEDYEFVGWCAGVLTGHMALYDRVKPTLAEISKRWKTEAQDNAAYEAQQLAGRDILAGFADAMRAAERGSTQALAPRGARAIAQGRDMWSNIDTVDDNSKAYSWMNWGLPGRCETVASRLKSRGNLMGALLRDNSESAIQTSAVRAVAARPDAAPVAARSEKTLDEVIAAVIEPAAAPQVATPEPVPAKPLPAVTAPKPAPAPAAVKPAPKPVPAPAANPAKAAGLR